jgi:hypothetical protein
MRLTPPSSREGGGVAVYADLETLKLALAGRPPGATTGTAIGTDRDALLNLALAAASQAIDDFTGRRFDADATATARVYRTAGRVRRGRDGALLLIDDVSSLTGLQIEVGYSGSYSVATDFETAPDNALVRNRPITGLLRPASSWPTALGRVRVTAKWGWPSVPDVVEQACVLQAARLYRRKDSPEGVVGNAEWGTLRVSRVDPDVQALLAPFVIPGIG